jgi:DNA-binding NarL/FixJ family response regulator
MRVVLIGSPLRRQQLRAALPGGIDVVGEAPTLVVARGAGHDADAYVIAAVARDTTDAFVESLTARETQVLELVADGLPNRAIATRLEVSEETVKFHLGSIFGKLGASNRTDAVRRALRRNLIPL